jgi:penicillin amidase
MDLSRRRAAGELSELFGRAALATDQGARLHRFRHRASSILAASAPEDVALLRAYSEGVNEGLEALGAAPFEYLLLRKEPAPWSIEDSVLVGASMFFSLQDSNAAEEARTALLYEAFPAELAEFLNTTNGDWDTPMQGDILPPPTLPDASVFSLGERPAVVTPALDPDRFAESIGFAPPDEARGSNNWVVAGSRTADVRALLSNDMHLGLSVPNIWYRASLVWTDDRGPHRVTGATLPGVPSMIVGSNGLIAWGFTNTTADWTDRVLLEPLPDDPSRYLTPDGPRAFEVSRERIVVDDEEDQWIEVRETIWGPVVQDNDGRLIAIAWVAHRPEGFNFHLSRMESAATLDEAMDVANRSGVPGQKCVLADSHGQIAWTVAGRIPIRRGFSGLLPVSWADGTRGWDGWYEPADYPRIVNPPDGMIVTANNRIVSGRELAMLGDGGYDPGARAKQILDGLRALEHATVEDMLSIQLSDRAELMERWRTLALDAIGSDTAVGRAEFGRLLKDDWSGHASIDSAGYRMARQFRAKTAELAFAPFVARLRVKDPSYPSTPGRSMEGAVWAMVSARPIHLLNPAYTDWNALFLDAIDQTVAALTRDGRALSDRT